MRALTLFLAPFNFVATDPSPDIPFLQPHMWSAREEGAGRGEGRAGRGGYRKMLAELLGGARDGEYIPWLPSPLSGLP